MSLPKEGFPNHDTLETMSIDWTMKNSVPWSEALMNLVTRLNNFDLPGSEKETCLPFCVFDKQVGHIPAFVMEHLRKYPDIFEIRSTGTSASVHLNSQLQTREDMTAAVARFLDDMRQQDVFVTLRGWRDELYEVYYNRALPSFLQIERAACSLFGTVQYGVHVNGYTFKDGELMMWIGRRSKTKQTFPDMLDNMCAGGLASGLSIRECVVKECQEEASVEDRYLAEIKSAGCVSYIYQDARGILPETQYVFDLQVPTDFVPRNADGEMQHFHLMSIDQVKTNIIDEKFKPNCALVIVDFFIRHGYMTADEEPHLPYLVEMMHRPLQPHLH